MCDQIGLFPFEGSRNQIVRDAFARANFMEPSNFEVIRHQVFRIEFLTIEDSQNFIDQAYPFPVCSETVCHPMSSHPTGLCMHQVIIRPPSFNFVIKTSSGAGLGIAQRTLGTAAHKG